jgi:hypothetical protein
MVEQRANTIASGGATDCRHIVLDSAVRIVQLEDELVRARNDRSEEAVTRFDASTVGVSGNRLPDWVGTRETLPKEMGTGLPREYKKLFARAWQGALFAAQSGGQIL